MTFESQFCITISQYVDLTGLSEARASNQSKRTNCSWFVFVSQYTAKSEVKDLTPRTYFLYILVYAGS